MAGKIDVHAHFLSPKYRQILIQRGHVNDGMPHLPEWTAKAHLDFMEANNISKAMLSVSSPGTSFTSDLSFNEEVTRESNDFGATMKRDYPSQFGYFATLPVPDVSASVKEIRRVLQGPVKADGFCLMSNTNNIYLGDPKLRPILEEIDSHGAVVFVHAGSPCPIHLDRSEQLSPLERYEESAPLATVYPAPAFEFLFDEARTFLDLIMTGSAVRFPRIRWIMSHCGGVLPSLIDRAILFYPMLRPSLASARDGVPITEDQINKTLKEQIWFDLAGRSVPNQLVSLLHFTGKDHVLFGSDTPWTLWENAGHMSDLIDKELPSVVGEEGAEMIYHGNAELLFPC